MVGKKPERKIHPISSGSIGVWDLLREELSAVPQERPENSITPEEFAAKTGYSRPHSERLLKNNPRLKPVKYRIGNTNRAGVCYVPKQPEEAA